MTERPQYPAPPWQLAVPVVAAVLAFTGALEGQKQFRPLLQREYLTTYALLSVAHASETSALISVNGELATLETNGVLHHEKRPIENGAQFRSWLEANIYEGQPIWRFLWLPELLAFIAFIPLLLWAVRSAQSAARDNWDGKVKRGASIISLKQWNRLIPRKNRGFYIETE
jgi:hypothetical protein